MASHRMSDRDRPRRPVPAWVTAPPLDEVASGTSPAPGLEARPTPGGPARPSGALAVTAVVTTAPAVTSGAPVDAPARDGSAPHAVLSGPAHTAPALAGTVPVGAAVSAHLPSGTGPSVEHAVPTAIDAADGPAAPHGTVASSGWPVPVTSEASVRGAGPASPASDLAALAGAAPGALPSADDVVVPDFPPQQDLLPPAPTSPAVQVPPTDSVPVAPGPARERSAPARAATAAPVPVAVPDSGLDPAVGRPRFSVPGLEHVLVEGTEPEPTGPIGYRTPARFARQQAPIAPQAPRDDQQSAPSFEPVLAPPTSTPTTADTAPDGGAAHRSVPHTDASGALGAAVPGDEDGLSVATVPLETIDLPEGARAARSARPRRGRGRSGPRAGRTSAPEARSRALGARAGAVDHTSTGDHASTGDRPGHAGRTDGRAPRLPAGSATTRTDRRPAVSPTTGGLLGALTGGATLALAAWWFTAPATVHATGIALGIVALVLSTTVLRDPTTTWQRPLALLGAVLGGVGTLVLLWALAAALLGAGGIALPDVTGTGVVPGVAP